MDLDNMTFDSQWLDPQLPAGYRWATVEEKRAFNSTGQLNGMIKVVVGGDDNGVWTDLAVKE